MSNACQKILRFDKDMRSIRYHLLAIENDLSFLKKGGKINYAIDFSIIHRYAFGILNFLNKNENSDSEIERTRFIQKAVGIRYLLNLKRNNQNEKIILIPPFAFELGSCLNRLSSGNIKAAIQVQKLRDLFTEHYKELNEFTEIVGLNHKDSKQENIDKCIEIILNDFYDLLLFWLAHVEGGIEAIQELFFKEKGNIQFIDTIWPEKDFDTDKFDELNIKSSKWFKMFHAVRNRPQSDFIDAQAVEIICQLNSKLQSGIDNEIVLLVSDAPTMTRVLNWDLIDVEPPKLKNKPRGIIELIDWGKNEYRFLRTPKTFLCYLLCEGTNEGDTLTNILTWKRNIDSYFTVAAKIVNDLKDQCCHDINPHSGEIKDLLGEKCEECPFKDNKEELNSLLKRYRHLTIQYENIQLFLNKEKYINSNIAEASLLSEDFEIKNFIAAFINSIVTSKETFDKILVTRENSVKNNLFSVITDIPTTTIQSASEKELRIFKQELSNVISLYDRIAFENAEIRNIFLTIMKLKASRDDIVEFKNCILKLLEICRKDGNEIPEAPMLKAFLAFVYKELNFCDHILNKELREHKNSFPLLYLKCLVACEKAKRFNDTNLFKEALQIAENLYSDFHNDPRACYLYGKKLLNSKDWLKNEISLDKITQIMRRGLSLDPTQDLALAILNSLSYSLCKYSEDIDDIVAANKLASEMKDIKPIDDWHAYYIDTIGCINYKIAVYSEDHQEKINSCLESISLFEKAIKLSSELDLPIYDIKRIIKHKRAAKKMLKKI